jgi:transposase-like protein
MKNKPLSAYKKKKLIESFCDELTATQAAHRLNLDRNTVNKYFKRIRECIAGYREYQKMKLMISVVSTADQQVQAVSRHITSANAREDGIPIRIMCIAGQLLTDVDVVHSGNGSKYMMNISTYFNGSGNGQSPHEHTANGFDCRDLERLADDFHLFTISRFKKFFGIKSEYAYLYVKEAEFIYNERDHSHREKVLHRLVEQIFL